MSLMTLKCLIRHISSKKRLEIKGFRGSTVFHSRASEALFRFIRLLLASSMTFGTYPSKTTIGGIIKIFIILP
nr:MAG TPA: hypothetical protein [Bacteriophage sp.]